MPPDILRLNFGLVLLYSGCTRISTDKFASQFLTYSSGFLFKPPLFKIPHELEPLAKIFLGFHGKDKRKGGPGQSRPIEWPKEEIIR